MMLTAGFKCYRRQVLETIKFNKIQFVGYRFQIEMKFKSWKYGFSVIEVPVIFTDRTQGDSKMSSGIFMEGNIFWSYSNEIKKSLFRKFNK